MATFLRALREWGPKETLRRIIYVKHLKFGTFKGADELGNKYFENAEDNIAGAAASAAPWAFPAGVAAKGAKMRAHGLVTAACARHRAPPLGRVREGPARRHHGSRGVARVASLPGG